MSAGAGIRLHRLGSASSNPLGGVTAAPIGVASTSLPPQTFPSPCPSMTFPKQNSDHIFLLCMKNLPELPN